MKNFLNDRLIAHRGVYYNCRENTISAFKEAIKFVKGRVPIIIEIKSINKKYELEKEVANILDKFDYEFAIQSFNILSLRWFKKNNPQYIRGYLVNGIYSQNKLFNIFILSKLFKYNIAPYYIGIDIKSLDNNNSKKARKKYNIIGYTINNKKEYEKYHNLADNFICNIGKEPFY